MVRCQSFAVKTAYRLTVELISHLGSNRGKTPIPAVGNGTVRLTQWSAVLGWVLVHTVWDVKKKKAAFVGYSHLSCKTHGVNCKGGHPVAQALDLKIGDKVKEGQTIGIMGNTGSATSGVHLHLTISWTEKGVFGATSQKFDFVEWVKTQAKQENPKAQAVVLPKVTRKNLSKLFTHVLTARRSSNEKR
jgi:murein DD-endopeptidase MepM/ murein hydrolase activator NlpD